MRINLLKGILRTGVRAATVLLFGAGVASAQSVNLTAKDSSVTLPDGSSVPMWTYNCTGASGASCSALNSTAGTGWSPVVITVASGSNLTINLTNNLPGPVPTSLVIVGQVGGGLGAPGGFTDAPDHSAAQTTTWPIADPTTPGNSPAQGKRVQSFGTEVGNGATKGLTWNNLQAGTYLLESGTHPSIQAPMGLVGMVVVTQPGTAYQGVSYNTDLPMLFSEIDPAQNRAVETAVKTPGFLEGATLNRGFGGPVTTVTVADGGSGYTSAPTVSFSPAGAAATADVDPTTKQVTAIHITNGGSYTSTTVPTVSFTGGGGSGALATATLQVNAAQSNCTAPATACYPPVVNYSPRYYLINGVAFNKTNTTQSLFPAAGGTPLSGKVLVRLVNAGSRMHVPTIVGAQTGDVSSPAAGFSLIAEDGNVLPGVPRVQSEVFMAAGKTYDVMINAATATGNISAALPIFDRQLSLSANSINRDGGMLAYISLNGAGLGTMAGAGSAQAVADLYQSVVPGQTLKVSDPSKGVIANDSNIFGVQLSGTAPTQGTVTLHSDGTFEYVANSGFTGTDSFSYCGNGATAPNAACTTVTLGLGDIEAAGGIICDASSFTSNIANSIKISAPGVLQNCRDGKGYPLSVSLASGSAPTVITSGLTVSVDADGSFKATTTGAGTYLFSFFAQNSQGTVAGSSAQVTLTFANPSNLKVSVVDGNDKSIAISDYRWIIEEDRTFYVNPSCPLNPTTCNPINFGTNFHTSFMPVVATGCTGPISCGASQTVLGQAVAGESPSDPANVALDPNKRYYISVLPGDAAQPFINGYAGSPTDCANSMTTGTCGHGMGGAPIPVVANGTHDSQQITIVTEPSPYPPATLSVFVFEDDYPLNGEHDAGGGVDIISPNEPGLGGFQITLQDDAGGTGDATGTPTYDMFNMPLSNSLAGTIDPVTHLDACPIASKATTPTMDANGNVTSNTPTADAGISGMIITCPTYEADGKTMSPLAGQAVVKNLYQGRYGVVAQPGADRFGRGEEWLQTNTLDGQKAHDSFMRIGEPGYFQEFGPAGYHVTIGFANPKLINDRLTTLCNGRPDCLNEVTGHVTTARMSRTPDERLYGSGTHDSYAFTQCYVSIGDPDGAEFAFSKCAQDGTFDFKGIPPGNWKITTFDQWNDQVVDGITTPVQVTACASTSCKVDLGEVAVHQWQSNIYTRTFIDLNGDGVSNVDQNGNPTEPGLPLVDTNIRFRDGSYSNFNSTDLNGFAGFNEVFPLFNWYVIETDTTRYKTTGIHVVYDSGGPVDGSSPAGVDCSTAKITADSSAPKTCGSSVIAGNLANTYEPNPLPADLSLPGSVYCQEADCKNQSIASGPVASSTDTHSTGRIDAPWVSTYGWQGYSGQNNFLEFGKKPFAEGETGGIYGHVVYASTRPFDDPQLLLQLSWEPLVPHVQVNLYQEGFAADGITPTLNLVDHTETSSFDDWAQGFHDLNGKQVPNMNCPGQGTPDSLMPDTFFWATLQNQPQYLDFYNHNNQVAGTTPLPYQSQFKCYDGMHNWNQLQPAPYDGMYNFPSVTSIDPVNGKSATTNCHMKTTLEPWGCTANPDTTDPYRNGAPMLPPGKYVVEVVVPPGYELVKEEDKNILIGDNFIAPVTQQFGGLGSIFILPDQADVANGNSNNVNDSTNNQGRDVNLPSHEGDTGSVETFWPCVGKERVVPDFISLFPGSAEVSPFAGATRHLCDRKEVTLTEQTSALAKFYIFTETHKAAHFTGVITDDFTAEFDPFSPQFGEKFAPAFLPVSWKDWAGNEISRVYSDAWGAYNGLNYSTWEVNPPNPTGYGPTMMVGCMNDAGPVNGQTDPLFQEGYSQFCYELPFMPGQTGYFDTPVVPTSAFAGGYNPPDCAYPNATPAVKEVDGDGVGPWVAGLKGTVTSVAVQNGGTGYTSAPTVTIGAPNSGTNTATATAVISGAVSKVNISNAGEYQGIPSVSFNGGGGTGAVASAVMSSNNVFSVNITNGGSNYTNTPTGRPTVSFTGGGGSGAAATAVVATTGPNAGRVTGVNFTNRGTGYTSAPTVSFTGGSGSGARGTASTGHTVASVTINNGGSGYTSAPTVTFSNAANNGTRAQGSAAISAAVVAINITNAGSGYASAPGVTVTAPASGTQATALASIETDGSLTITALGDQSVDNYGYSGPNSLAPYNNQKITRHYSFGDAPTDFSNFSACSTAGTCNCSGGSSTQICPNVTVGGQPLTAVSWNSAQITGTVPANVPDCAVQQQAIYGGSHAQCGELSITTKDGVQSIDSVTVTIGGKAPKYVSGNAPLTASGFGAIQQKIDAAQPGDLIIVPPGTYSEMVLMWQPVRLQGVGAASSIIDANAQPAGKLDPWRQRIVCLFGLALNGVPITGSNPYNSDPNSTVTCDPKMQFSVDRLPLEATVGWDATLNGNLAEQLSEPTIMGAYEGAGITVLAKGVKFPDPSHAFDSDVFPDGTQLLTTNDCLVKGTNPYPGNFLCNPSSIDGLTVKNSSQGGGGIMIHGWGHELQIANNRVMNNQGTLSGGITIGQGEHPEVYQIGNVANTVPGSCINPSNPANLALPYCFNMDVNVHHNAVTRNSSLGDELFSSTPAGAGGVTFCSGADYYKFDYNWICGNMSTGDGAGVAHVGFSYDGDIQHNTILFNETTNPTIVTNGGGLLIMGAPDIDTTSCGVTTDQDCLDNPGNISPSDGTGPALVINANLILGNSADSGSGGGIRLQHINGSEVLNFVRGGNSTRWPTIPGHGHPTAQPSFQTSTPWNAVLVTNNIIANNVAGWDGGGISLQDALATNLVNNTVVSNNSTASSGVLFQTLFSPLASTDPGAYDPKSTQTGQIGTSYNCSVNNGTQSCPQPAGLVSVGNSAVLQANMANLPGGIASIVCPSNHGANDSKNNNFNSTANCTKYSIPLIENDLFWQNRSLVISVGSLGTGITNQQNTVTMFNPNFGSAASQIVSQTATGSCDANLASTSSTNIWDIGVRGDTQPGGTHPKGGTLQPLFSLLTNSGNFAEGNSTGTMNTHGEGNVLAPASSVNSTYCNGSRVPVEALTDKNKFAIWGVPPGTNESNALPTPVFSLTAGAVVDEGNNWINLRWGPLSLSVPNADASANAFNFDAKIGKTSGATDKVPSTAPSYADAPSIDFYGNPRKAFSTDPVDIGAVEYQAPPTPFLTVTPTSLSFGTVTDGQSSSVQTLTLRNTGNAQASSIAVAVTAPFARSTSNPGTCGTTLGFATNQNSCTINVVFTPGSTDVGPLTGTATITANVSVTNSPVALSGTARLAGSHISVSPASLSFGNWATGTTSPTQNVTVVNTGSNNLAGGSFTVPAGFTRVTNGTFPNGAGNCGATLNTGNSCTIKVAFSPTSTGTVNSNLSVSYTGVTPILVGLSGTGVASRATVSITPNPLTITLPSGAQNLTGTGTVTFANTAAAGGAQVTVTNIGVSGGSFTTYLFNVGVLAGPDNCTGAVLAPGANCTVTVRFTNIGSARGTNRTGTITFTDSGAGNPQSSGLVGFATP
jgi:hypothetical protein